MIKHLAKVFVKTTIKTTKVTSVAYGLWALGYKMGALKTNSEWGAACIEHSNQRRDKEQ